MTQSTARADQFDRHTLVEQGILPFGIAIMMQRHDIPIHREDRRTGRSRIGVGSIVDPGSIAVQSDHGLGWKTGHRSALVRWPYIYP